MKVKPLLAGLLFLTAAHAAAETFAILPANGEIDAPDGFTPLSKSEIAQKYPYRDAPFMVLGNAGRSTTISVNLYNEEISNERLDEKKQELETLLDRMTPGIQWQKREITELNGRKWVYLEFTSHAVDTDIHNMMLITPRLGRMLLFNFNATREDFAAMEQPLRDSMRTISLP